MILHLCNFAALATLISLDVEIWILQLCNPCNLDMIKNFRILILQPCSLDLFRGKHLRFCNFATLTTLISLTVKSWILQLCNPCNHNIFKGRKLDFPTLQLCNHATLTSLKRFEFGLCNFATLATLISLEVKIWIFNFATLQPVQP